MALFKSGNPALSNETFNGFTPAADDANVMTLEGTVNKTGLLLLLVGGAAVYTWNLFTSSHDFNTVAPFLWTGCLGGFGVALVIIFNKSWSPFLAPVYAVLQGLCLGGLSAAMNTQYPGIALQSLLLTVGICFCMLTIYRLKIIKPTENTKLVIASATAGIAVYYLVSIVLSFFNIQAPLINDNGPWGIVFTLFVVVVAALNLVVDFDFIEQGVNNKVPKYMEWYGAFGVMVTLIWLYIEILRLLGKVRSRK